MKLALAQINPTVGAIVANERLIVQAIDDAARQGADLVVLPELAVCGYPPRDLLHYEDFVRQCEDAARRIGRACPPGLTAVFGCPLAVETGRGLANGLVAYRDGERIADYRKRLLPTYDVFDEDRYFEPGTSPVVIDVAGVRVGLSVCEDLWKGEDVGLASRYVRSVDPVVELVGAGATVIVNPAASPFVLGKGRRHRDLLVRHARKHGVAIASVNQVGGNDDLIFDGHSAVYGPAGELIGAAPGFQEHMLIVDLAHARPEPDPRLEASSESLVFEALRLGLRDYARKTGFSRAIVGLSGGLDSALTCALGVAALGAENMTGVIMPGPYSSDESRQDALETGDRLGVRVLEAPIVESVRAIKDALDPAFAQIGAHLLGESLPDTAHENVQARLRGVVLMALANRTGDLLLTTGNKSELAVGYCTLYGDMNGGLAVLSDVLKTQVYAISRWMNKHRDACGFRTMPIPARSITKPPSAELAPDQKDQDSLPEYDVLDAIIEGYVDRKDAPGHIARHTGIDEAVVARVARMIEASEHKRVQAAIGLKITGAAFGSGRRMPVAHRWRGA